jgi:hypothetical protein
VSLGNEAALGMESPTDALSANVSVMPVWSLAITSRGLHVGHMGAVVVHCMGTSSWRQLKTGPIPRHRGFLPGMATGDRRRHAFERVLVSTRERLSKKIGVALGSVYASSVRPVQRLRAASWLARSSATPPIPIPR